MYYGYYFVLLCTETFKRLNDMTETEYLEMKKKIRAYEYNQQRKEMKRIQKVKPSISDLDISVRLYNILKENGIETIDEMLTKRFNEFVRLRNFGKVTTRELVKLYEEKNWEFQSDPLWDDYYKRNGYI